MRMRWSWGVAALACALCAASWGQAPNPAEPGPYPVGVTTKMLVDANRPDEALGGYRTLMCEIWYPATEDTRGLPRPGLIASYLAAVPDAAFGLIKALTKVDLRDFDETFEFFALRDARVRDGVYPLVVFSHGHAAARFQSIFWCEHLASHGYLVVAPDHTHNSLVTFIDGKPVALAGMDRELMAPDRPKDVRFLIDAFEWINNGADSRFAGRIDLDHVGVAGHSFGGYTAAAAADADPRVKAVIPMAGVYVPERTRFDCPVLILDAGEDRIMGRVMKKGGERYSTMAQYFDASTGPKYRVVFVNGGHFTFSEIFQCIGTYGDGVGTGTRITNGEPLTYTPMDRAFALINGYSTAFSGKFLKGVDAYDAYLDKNWDENELDVAWRPAQEAAHAAP